jgi:Protein of unknown function (DUF2752)
LATGAALVAFNDPASAGSRFPACAFHRATGLWCPGCGLTRGTHHLLNGDPIAALGSNVFTPLVLTAIVITWTVWMLSSVGHPLTNPIERLPRRLGPVLLVVVAGYGVVRNIDVVGLRALAP